MLERWHGVTFALIAVGFIAATTLGASLPDDGRILLLAGLVAVLGVPHGALDPLLAREKGAWRDGSELARYLTAYVALALGVLLAWKMAPGPSLGVFLALSAWHFGGDWAGRLGPWKRLACGTGVVTVPCVSYSAEVSRLFAFLVPETDAVILTAGLAMAAPATLAAMLFIAIAARRSACGVSAELLAIVSLAVTLEPLAFFAMYFCALHSPRHLLRAAPQLTHAAPSTAVLTTVALTLLTSGIGAAVLLATQPALLDAALMRVVFVGLFALTVPHMLLGGAYTFNRRRRPPAC